MKQWEGKAANCERITWLSSCYGILLNVWNVSTFQKIGEQWGIFIGNDEATLKLLTFDKGMMLIATERPSKIDEWIQLNVESKMYKVMVEEAKGQGLGHSCRKP